MYPRSFVPAAFAGVLALALLPLPRTAASQIQPPMIRVLEDGQVVNTIATEASDGATAAALGVTVAPPLANAIGNGTTTNATSNRYVVTNFKQPDVLAQSSIPTPPGPNNTNGNYSPLWQVNLVTWNHGTNPAQLSSEADIKAAQSKKEVTVTPTNIVINGPVVSTSGGSILPLGTLDGFALGDDLQNLLTDTTSQSFAQAANNKANNANFAPKLGNLQASATLNLYKFLGNPSNPDQLTFFDTHPQPVGPRNGDSTYTPLWEVVQVMFTSKEPMPFPVIISSAQLDDEEKAGDMTEGQPLFIVDCPIIKVAGKAIR